MNTPVVKVSKDETRTDFMYGIGAALVEVAALLVDEEVLVLVEVEVGVEEEPTAWALKPPVELEDEEEWVVEEEVEEEVEPLALPEADEDEAWLLLVEDEDVDEVETARRCGALVEVDEVDETVDEGG